ncbi:MAG: hypothetical protein IKK51_09095 [Oscillospiraceae bacterium]|nr:hypothetical protein [Oscillospiraceae bacterium]MBR4102014.1 hypothetical protein [Oscillospiraceae bacterium]
MKNWKLIAIIGATAVATAIAVVVLIQKQNNKRRMRFDSAEFDDDCLDDIACGEQCACCGEDLDVVLPGEETVEEVADAVADAVEDVAEAVEDVIEDAE